MNEMTTAAGPLLPCGEGPDARYCPVFWEQHAELDRLRAQLDEATRERDSLARRCGVRFEER